MILTDKRIRELVNEKKMIEPFVEQNLQSESYDLTIGDKITALKKEEVRCLDIAGQEDIDDIYQEISILEEGYVISSKEYVLVSIGEDIHLPDDITAHLRAKTRFTRLGLLVSDQHCNSTYSGHLRIGLFNATEYPIRIRKGCTIAQLVFEQLPEIPSENKQYKNKKNAHYQNENGKFRGAKFDDAFLESVLDDILK